MYDTEKPKGPKRINLNDPASSSLKTYTPPTSLKVHLSKIDMPELKPKPDTTPTKTRPPAQNLPPAPPPPVVEAEKRTPEKGKSAKPSKREEREREKERERERQREQEREKAQKKAEKEAQRKAEKDAKKNKKGALELPSRSGVTMLTFATDSSSKPEVNKLTRPHSTLVTSPGSGPTLPYPYGPSPFTHQAPQSSPFPQPPPPRPASAFYGGSSFPSQMPPPPNHPAAPRPRPASFYGPGSFQNSAPGQNATPGFRPFLQP